MLPPPLIEKQVDESVHLPNVVGLAAGAGEFGCSPGDRPTKFCQVGDPSCMEARLALDQGDVELLENKVGWTVEIMLAQTAEVVYVSKVESVSNENIKITSDPSVESARGRSRVKNGSDWRGPADQHDLRSDRAAA